MENKPTGDGEEFGQNYICSGCKKAFPSEGVREHLATGTYWCEACIISRWGGLPVKPITEVPPTTRN